MALKVGAAKRPISIAIEFKKITGIKGPFGPLREGLGGQRPIGAKLRLPCLESV